MGVVRRIFEMVASGTPMWAVKTTLETEEVPAPGGGRRWSQTTLRKILQEDFYIPHSIQERAELGTCLPRSSPHCPLRSVTESLGTAGAELV